AVIGSITAADGSQFKMPYHWALFTFEAGAWKLESETSPNEPIDPAALYAFVPPEGGAFTRARSPWTSVPYAAVSPKVFKIRDDDCPFWKMQATFDDSFLYMRLEASSLLPQTGMPRKLIVDESKATTLRFRVKLTGQNARIPAFELEAGIGT